MAPIGITPHPPACVLLHAGITGLAQPASAQRNAWERTEEENVEKGVGNVTRDSSLRPNKARSASELEQNLLRWLVLVGIWGREGGSGVTMAGKLLDDGLFWTTPHWA